MDFKYATELFKNQFSSFDKVSNSRNVLSILLFGIDDDRKHLIDKELHCDFELIYTQDIIQALDYIFMFEIHLVMTEIRWDNLDAILFSKFLKSHPEYSYIPNMCFVDAKEVELKACVLSSEVDILIDLPIQKEFLKLQVQNILNNRSKVINYVLHNSKLKIDENQVFNQVGFMEKLYSCIESSLHDENLSVPIIAEKMNMSRSTLYRKIQHNTSITLNTIIKQFKLKKAAHLLLQNNLSVAQVSYMVGYSIQSNFSRDFLKIFGIRPSAFRLSQVEKNQIDWNIN